MRIELFVVLSEIGKSSNPREQWRDLEVVKCEIIREFGGLTQSGLEKGYWCNKGEICIDTVERWLIYTSVVNCQDIIEPFAKRIKKITSQDSQAYGIDGKMYYC